MGWESTFLDLPQVHAFLQALFAPVVAVLPLEAFSMAELERMHFRSGVEVGRAEARRWVGLYLGLLALVVMLPRLLLAAQATLQRMRLARRVRVDLGDPYHEQVLGRVSPARVLLCLLPGPLEGSLALRHVLRSLADRAAPEAGAAGTLLGTARGDELGWMELAGDARPPDRALAAPAGWRGWLSRWSARPAARGVLSVEERARRDADVVLCPVSGGADLESAGPMLRWLARPVLVLPCGPALDAGSEALLRGAMQRLGPPAELLPLVQACATWRHESALRDAIARLLPAHKAPGMARISQAWSARHEARCAESMRLLAEELLQAARDAQPVAAGPLDLRRLVRPADREADARARESATQALRERLRERHLRTSAELLRLHGVDDAPAGKLSAPVQSALVVRQGVDSPQAGMAGAASGAALGATVDLMVGGITLGAAAALGAVLGGGAAFVTAAWKNRATPGGATLVQLQDEMLDSMVTDAILRYLVAVHAARRVPDTAQLQRWKEEAGAAVRAAREALAPLWGQARSGDGGPLPVAALAQRLTDLALAVLERLDAPPAQP